MSLLFSYIEMRGILPGSPDISGLWPAAWTMGNLGRAGFGATTDGMWYVNQGGRKSQKS